MNRNRQHGITLIELMIVVGIVAILAGFAYPTYMDSVRKSRRADGMGSLIAIQVAQEKMRANCRFYAQSLDATNDVCGANAAGTTIRTSATSTYGHYTVALSNASGTGYTATATGQGNQAEDDEGGVTCTLVLTVNAANPDGLRTPADCWN